MRPPVTPAMSPPPPYTVAHDDLSSPLKTILFKRAAIAIPYTQRDDSAF